MTIAIHAEGLSKKYLIRHHQARRNTSLGEILSHFFSGSSEATPTRGQEEFWALQDVSFTIEAGDRVGVIGRNGAGKSTLLKILSRITEPTSGRVTIRGRVASLLEVGTGFHPELTGRENVFLNGAVLGMKRDEIRRKFDEIVAFAEVEKFLDMPVKRYSSGMYVRLAFAVAAHLEPEILIVDEALAVGDAAFQKKCLARMITIGEAGTTVLFVSHNIAAIQHLCNSAILLGHGRVQGYGGVEPVMHQYLEQTQQLIQTPLGERDDRGGNGALRFARITMQNGSGATVTAFHCGQAACMLLGFTAGDGVVLADVVMTVTIENEFGTRVAELSNALSSVPFPAIPASTRCVQLQIPQLPFMPGTYRLGLHSTVNGELADVVEHAASLTVEPGDFFGTGRLPASDGQTSLLVPHGFALR